MQCRVELLNGPGLLEATIAAPLNTILQIVIGSFRFSPRMDSVSSLVAAAHDTTVIGAAL